MTLIYNKMAINQEIYSGTIESVENETLLVILICILCSRLEVRLGCQATGLIIVEGIF